MKKFKILVLFVLALAFGFSANALAQVGNDPNSGNETGAMTQPVIGMADGIEVSASGNVPIAVDGIYSSAMLHGQPGSNAKLASRYGDMPSVEKTYSPSKKALKADPHAANTAILEGYTKSVGAIHAAYEELDDDLYPYEPYYEYPDYYVMHTNDSRMVIDHDFAQLMKSSFAAAGTGKKMQILTLRTVKLEKQKGKHNYYDETVRNAYSALFMSDPLSMDAFGCLVRTLVLDDPRACPLEFPMENPDKGIISVADNFVLAFKSYDKFIQMRNNRRDQALSVARSITPINIVRNSIEQWLNAIPNAKDAEERYTLYWLANEAYEEVLTRHDRYVPGDLVNRALGKTINECRKAYPNIISEGKMGSMEEQNMPRYFTVKSVNATKLKQAAQAVMPEGYEVVKVLCLNKQWETGSKSRTIEVGVVARYGAYQFLFPRTLTENKKGKGWSGVYTVSGEEKPFRLKVVK